jgi:thymidylate synthase (FAD)
VPYEIRAYAEVLLDVGRRWVPLTCAAFEDYRLNAGRAVGQALAVLRRMLAGGDVSQADRGLSAREWRELRAHPHLACVT